MPYDSPLASPGQYVTRIDDLSNEAVTIDKGVGNAKRDAADFASKYAGDFSLVTDLKSKIEEFSDVCWPLILCDLLLTCLRHGSGLWARLVMLLHLFRAGLTVSVVCL